MRAPGREISLVGSYMDMIGTIMLVFFNSIVRIAYDNIVLNF